MGRAIVTGQAGQHAHDDRQRDVYETPACATLALLNAEEFFFSPRSIWEPACGPGAMVWALRNAGHRALGSDVGHFPDRTMFYGRNFFHETVAPKGTDAIMTNPPYKLAEEFVEHALQLCPRVFMLLRLAFLESVRRTKILEESGLRKVYVFRNRLPMMHRAGWNGEKIDGSAIAFAWYYWDRDYRYPIWDHSKGRAPELHRISWE